MELKIAAMVLLSAALHPLWNAMIKREKRIDGAFIGMVTLLMFTSFSHATIMGYDLLSVAQVWPLIALSVAGQLLYGISLIRTLGHGDLSVYYPIIRSSPLFIVIVGLLFLGESYTPQLLVGIACVLIGAFVLQYRRGSHIFHDPKTMFIALLAMSGTGIYSIADARAMQAIEPPVLFFWVEASSLPVYIFVYRFFGLPGTRLPDLFSWTKKPLLFLGLAAICYSSYWLILTAYGMGGDVAAVTSVRQASIPISVILGGLMFREGSIVRRLIASLVLAGGIVGVVLAG
ncbi:MAG: EamA family transporter [Rhodospirillaceae bacterium]|nr:EamA family transporter [Rhodospirillaceae bacterium]